MLMPLILSKYQIIPRAVDYFTGKALEYDAEELEDDDDEDEDEDDEDVFDDEDVCLFRSFVIFISR